MTDERMFVSKLNSFYYIFPPWKIQLIIPEETLKILVKMNGSYFRTCFSFSEVLSADLARLK